MIGDFLAGALVPNDDSAGAASGMGIFIERLERRQLLAVSPGAVTAVSVVDSLVPATTASVGSLANLGVSPLVGSTSSINSGGDVATSLSPNSVSTIANDPGVGTLPSSQFDQISGETLGFGTGLGNGSDLASINTSTGLVQPSSLGAGAQDTPNLSVTGGSLITSQITTGAQFSGTTIFGDRLTSQFSLLS